VHPRVFGDAVASTKPVAYAIIWTATS
jgi:hypothetical protein